MVSKARDDLPEPDSPVTTTSWSRGILMSTFFRLCSRAPRTRIASLYFPARMASLYFPRRIESLFALLVLLVLPDLVMVSAVHRLIWNKYRTYLLKYHDKMGFRRKNQRGCISAPARAVSHSMIALHYIVFYSSCPHRFRR